MPPGKWTPYTQRTGVIARKRGMTSLWDQEGRRWPVTVLQVGLAGIHSKHQASNASDSTYFYALSDLDRC